MLKQISFILLLFVSAFNLNAFAQTPEEAYTVRNSALAAINLPGGAMRVREQHVPAEIKKTLAKLIEAGGERVAQGESEVVIWAGDGYKKADNPRLLKQLENNLKQNNWEMEIGASSKEFVLFSLLHNESRRALVGFFVPSDDAFIFAVTEMLRATPTNNGGAANGKPAKAGQNQNTGNDLSGNENSDGGSANLSALSGKWESAKLTDTNMNNYGSILAKGSLQFFYEFFPDGTIEVKQRSAEFVGACWTETIVTSRGRASLNGDSLTIDYAPAKLVFNASCEKGYEKTFPARTEIVKISLHEQNNQKQLRVNAGKGEILLKPVK